MEFSDKIEPLFRLLPARSIVNDPKFKSNYSEEEQKEWVALSKVDTVLFSGGRDSSKTYSLSTFNVVASRDYGHRILYTRQTMSSTDSSITEALENRMEDLGCEGDFIAANKIYTLKPDSEGKERKGRITITGQKTSVGTQTAKLKSLEDFSIFETDEGEELESYDSWMKTKRSMRAKDVQCLAIISFNPPTREHWLYEEFYHDLKEGFNGIKDNILYIHTTYLDNGQENMAEHNWREYEDLRLAYEEYLSTPKEERDNLPKALTKKYKQYKHDILGGFKEKAEGVIYDDWEEGEFPTNMAYIYGLDFGSNDPDALTKVAVDRGNKKMYIKEIFFKNNNSTPYLMEVLANKVGHSDLIIADAAERRLIRDLEDGVHGEGGSFIPGVNIRKCVKSKSGKDNFVKWSIKKCQGFTLIVDPSSTNLKHALNNYVWNDKRAGVPKHDWSDLCDSFRYAAIELLR